MTLMDHDDITIPDSPPVQKAPALSLLGQVFAEVDAGTGEQSLVLPIPGRDGLAARYRVLSEDDLEALQSSDGIAGNIDFIARACEVLLVRDGDGEWIDLRDDKDRPVVFNAVLAGELGRDDLKSVRDVVRHVFRGNPVALGIHADRIMEWMGDTSADVEGRILGK